MRKILGALAVALGLVAPLGMEVVEAPPVAAAVTHSLRYTINTNNYTYDAQFVHHDNGVNEVNVYRFTFGGQYYLAHDLHIEAYDYVCFQPLVQTGSNELQIYVWANAATDGVGNGPCTFPWYTVNPSNCLPYHVFTRNGTYYGYNPSYTQCPYSGAGHHAYGPNVLLQEQYPLLQQGATDSNADVFRFYT